MNMLSIARVMLGLLLVLALGLYALADESDPIVTIELPASNAAPASRPLEPKPVDASGAREASVAKLVTPMYPLEAIRERVGGEVVMRVHVAADGRVLDTDVVKSSGHQALDEAALNAVRASAFHPALKEHRPIDSVIEVPTSFAVTTL